MFFSRRFSRKEPTIVMAFRQCFFCKTTWTDQNSSTKSSTKFSEDAKMYLGYGADLGRSRLGFFQGSV